MSYLLDTSAVLQLAKLRRDPGLTVWLNATDEALLFLSVVTIAETSYGIDRLRDERQRAKLEQWLSAEFVTRFGGRILVIDEVIADCWGRMVAKSRSLGRPISGMDAFLAATAQCKGLTLVTRNVANFSALDVPIVSPWSASA